jgi:hypothetical protein
MPTYAAQSPTNPMRGLFRGDTGYSFGAIGVGRGISTLSRAANGIVTLVTQANPSNFAPGEICTLQDGGPTTNFSIVAAGGTRFGGNYAILTVSGATHTLAPLDDILLHQPVDTAVNGRAFSPQFEFPASGTAGQAFALASLGDMSTVPWGFFVDGIFQAAPTFEIDVQVAAVDSPTQYQTILNGVINTVDGTNFTFHFDASQTGAKFVRLFMRTNTGSLGVIARIRG